MTGGKDMEAIDVGWLSILPPIIAIGLALLTKEVISSLLIGILSGTFIYSIFTDGGIVKTIDVTFSLMADKIGDNASILIFLGLLGALVAIITMAGGSKAYGDWASSKIKTGRGAKLATTSLGALIFIDDYFNCLTIGTVMRPVTDKQGISRAKLAYIIDATAAPVCIIAPISSWAASVVSQIDDVGLNGMNVFLSAIPFNFYAILTIIMVITLCVTDLEFGSMAKFEREARRGRHSDAVDVINTEEDEFAKMGISDKGRVLDLLIPVIALIIFCTLSMLYVGGYFNGGMSIAEGFGNTEAGPALVIGAFGALVVAFALFIPRRLLTFKQFMDGIGVGVKSMVGAFIILILAWTISGVCSDLLSTGEFVGAQFAASSISPAFIPVVVFSVAGLLSFAMGTSWGTFGILIPIVALLCESVAPELTIISLAATLAGSVLGDHCSPISDTTILSSTGAGCNHIDHVSTQIPYVLVVGVSCLVGYIIAGFTRQLIVSLGVAIVVMFALMIFLHKRSEEKMLETEK